MNLIENPKNSTIGWICGMCNWKGSFEDEHWIKRALYYCTFGLECNQINVVSKNAKQRNSHVKKSLESLLLHIRIFYGTPWNVLPFRLSNHCNEWIDTSDILWQTCIHQFLTQLFNMCAGGSHSSISLIEEVKTLTKTSSIFFESWC